MRVQKKTKHLPIDSIDHSHNSALLSIKIYFALNYVQTQKHIFDRHDKTADKLHLVRLTSADHSLKRNLKPGD